MQISINAYILFLHSVNFEAKAYFIEENYLTFNKARAMDTFVTKARDKSSKPFLKIKIYPKDTFSKWDRDENDTILKFSFTLANGTRVPFEKDKHIMAIMDWEGECNKRDKKYYFNNGKFTKESEIKLETVKALEKGTVN